MRKNVRKKIGNLILGIICFHFICYFPSASAEAMGQMNHDMKMIKSETYTCCEQQNAICHDVEEMSFLSFATFKTVNSNLVQSYCLEVSAILKSPKFFNTSIPSDSLIENIRTVQIIV